MEQTLVFCKLGKGRRIESLLDFCQGLSAYEVIETAAIEIRVE